MARLQDLPFELLEQICDLIAGVQPRNLVPFSQVSKVCLAASSQSLWETVPLRVTSRYQVQEAVDKLKCIMSNRLSRDGRIRCISIRGRKPLDRERDRRLKLGPLERAYLDDLAWKPLANFLTEVLPLSDFEWEKDELPPCILQSLNRHHHNCKLRVAGTCSNADRSLDPDERPMATSSFRYEILLPLEIAMDLSCETLSGRRVHMWHGIRTSVATIGSLAPRLTTAKHPYWNPHFAEDLVQRSGPDTFELPLFDSGGPRMRYRVAALWTLNLSIENASRYSVGIRHCDVSMWSKITQFSALRVFEAFYNVHKRALEWLAANRPFRSLRKLALGLHSHCILQSPSVLVDFLCSLPPLESITLAGEYNARGFEDWLPDHAATLRRLQLETLDRYDSVFDLESLKVLDKTPLPFLERLSISIKRSKGDLKEVSIYKMLGAMTRLQSIILRLDCSDHSVVSRPRRRLSSAVSTDRSYRSATTEDSATDFWQRSWELDMHISGGHPLYADFRDALMNSATDEKLAKAIFDTISSAKSDRSLPLERLEIRPSGGCDFGGELFRFSKDWTAVMKRIQRSWLVTRRCPGLGSEMLLISQIPSENLGRKGRLPAKLKPEAEAICRKVWAMCSGTEYDWQKNWHSFPLAIE